MRGYIMGLPGIVPLLSVNVECAVLVRELLKAWKKN
jgi:hypothetical protein